MRRHERSRTGFIREKNAGKIAVGRTEVVELAADPNHLERGRLEIRLEGGL